MPTLNINNLDATQEIGWGSGFRMGKDNVYRGHGTAGSVPQLAKWFAGGISGKKVGIVGDSTSDGAGNAVELYSRLNYYLHSGAAQGGPRLPSVTITDLGANGSSANQFATTGVADAISAACDLYVYSYGINDVRQGACDKETLKTRIRSGINQLRAAVPGACYVLRMPNPLKTLDDGYVVPYTSAPAYSQILHDAYEELADEWDDAVVMDTWTAIFGKPDEYPELLVDSLHPVNSYAAIADQIVGLIGEDECRPSVRVSQYYQVANYADCYVDYPPMLDILPRFQKLSEGTVLGSTTGIYNLQLDKNFQQHFLRNSGIIIWQDGAVPFKPGVTGTNNGGAAGYTTFLETCPVTLTAGRRVRVYRDLARGDATLSLLYNSRENYPFFVPVTLYGITNYFSVTPTNEIPNSPGVLSYLTTSDAVYVEGGTTISLSGSTFAPNSTAVGITKTGNFNGLSGKIGVVCGTSIRSSTHLTGVPGCLRDGNLWLATSNRVQIRANSITSNLLESRNVTEAQRLAIASPYVGQIVYQTDGTEGYYVYKSGGWAAL